ncbi:MAG: NADH-quinone oxidoreductase subunit NuoE [Gammaproteobacteria bacterium]
MKTNNSHLLTEEVRTEIDKWVAKYPPEHKRSAALTALTLAQKQNNGWLPLELQNAVADYLDMPHIAVHELVTFYSLLETKPVGKHKILVCASISCMLRGASKVIEYLEQRLGIKSGETTSDGKFTLKHFECLAACTNAPMMQIGDVFYEDLTPEKIDAILQQLESEN